MTTWRISTNAQASHALANAKAGDVLDVNAILGPIKTGRDGLTFDFRDGGINARGADAALLLLDADGTTIKGGRFFGAKGAGIAANRSDDLRIGDADVYDNGAHGISVIRSDQARIARVDVHDNAKGKGHASGISIFHPIAKSDKPGYHFVVTNSDVHDNGPTDERTTDAYGIIADDFNWTQSDEHPSFEHSTLISQNRVHGNGGPGIGAVWSDHVDMIGNTVTGNQLQDAYGRTPDVEIEFRQSEGRAIGNDLGDGDMLISGTKARPGEVSGHGNICDEIELRGVVLGVPEHAPGVDAHILDW